MKREIVIALVLSFVIILSVSLVSANIFTNFWNKITGKVTYVCGNGVRDPGELCDYAANDTINNPYGSQCSSNCWVNGVPPYWLGCRGSGIHVCTDNPNVTAQYFIDHPLCIKNPTCAGSFYNCNGVICPPPTTAEIINKTNNQGNSSTNTSGVIILNGTGTITECIVNGTLGSCGNINVTQTNGSIITNCREITSPGNYVLQNDIISTNGNICLNIHDTTQVFIDCQGKNIVFDGSSPNFRFLGAVNIKNVNNFSFKNCILNATNVPINLISDGLLIMNSSNGLIYNNNFNNYSGVIIGNSSSINTIRNNFSKSIYSQLYSNNNLIYSNNFDGDTAAATLVLISLTQGGNNIVTNNFVDGHGTGVPVGYHTGADDGILTQVESNDIINRNTIQNFWDCGIENLYLLQNTTISNNSIKNSLYCGIGGWLWNSLKSNTFSQNKVDNSGTIFTFYRRYALTSGENFVYFTNNNFTGNVLTNFNISLRGYATDITMDKNDHGEVNSSSFIASNDTFTNNDFGTGPGPYISPISAVVDGGGNKCGSPSLGQNSSPLVCNSISSNFTNSTNSSFKAFNQNQTTGNNCQGCFLNGKCYPLDYRTNGKYCSLNLTLIPQSSTGASCQNNFECGSNLCVSNQCISQSLLQITITLVKRFLGFS